MVGQWSQPLQETRMWHVRRQPMQDWLPWKGETRPTSNLSEETWWVAGSIQLFLGFLFSLYRRHFSELFIYPNFILLSVFAGDFNSYLLSSYSYDLHVYTNDIGNHSDENSGTNERHPDVGILLRSKCKWLQMDTWPHTHFYLLSPEPSVNLAKQVSSKPNKRLIALPEDLAWLWSYIKSMAFALAGFFCLFVF